MRGHSAPRHQRSGEMELKLGHLRFLISVAKHKNISKAAEELHISQPAVSKRILDLEKSLGVPLLDRSSRQIVPTRFGEAVIRSGEAILAEMNRIELELQHLERDAKSSVVIGTFPMMAAYLVPTAITRFIRDHDDLFVSVVEDNHFQLLSELRSGRLDFVVGAFAVDSDPELIEEVLFYDRWHAIVRKDHPLVGKPDLTIRELAKWEWVVPAKQFPAHRQWRNVFLSEGIDVPPHRIETTSAGTLRMMLLESDRIGYLTSQNFNLEIQTGLLASLPIELPTTSRAFGISRRARGTSSESAQKLIEYIREVAAEMSKTADLNRVIVTQNPAPAAVL